MNLVCEPKINTVFQANNVYYCVNLSQIEVRLWFLPKPREKIDLKYYFFFQMSVLIIVDFSLLLTQKNIVLFQENVDCNWDY